MKIRIDVDCTPEEARTFLGLPDVQPMQQRLMTDLEARMKAGLDSMTPDALFKTWLPASIEGFEQLQKAFWSNLAGSSQKPKKE